MAANPAGLGLLIDGIVLLDELSQEVLSDIFVLACKDDKALEKRVDFLLDFIEGLLDAPALQLLDWS